MSCFIVMLTVTSDAAPAYHKKGTKFTKKKIRSINIHVMS